MAQYTQKAIVSTFQHMLEEMPFEKITVSALVRRCEISSNTFYYHYRDIYHLLEVWMRGVLSKYTEGKPPYDSLARAIKGLLKACQDNSALIFHIFDSLSRDRLERYVYGASWNVFYRVVCGYADCCIVPEDKLREITDFCCYSFSGLFLHFLWGRMKTDVDTLADSYANTVETFIYSALSKYRGKCASM